MAEQNKIYLPPTGQLSIKLDWTDELTAAPRDNETLLSVTWTMPNGLTELNSSNTPTAALLTIGTLNQPIGLSDFIICTASLSGGDVISARIPVVIKYLETTITG